MTYEEQEAIVIPLSIYDDCAKKLEADAELAAYSTWSTSGRDFDDSVLDELRSILRNAAEEVRAVLRDKMSELPDDIDECLLDAYGLN